MKKSKRYVKEDYDDHFNNHEQQNDDEEPQIELEEDQPLSSYNNIEDHQDHDEENQNDDMVEEEYEDQIQDDEMDEFISNGAAESCKSNPSEVKPLSCIDEEEDTSERKAEAARTSEILSQQMLDSNDF